jgi:gliding motility-associated-like protein
MKRSVLKLLPLLLVFAGMQPLAAQTYVPVAVTGFNNDVVAEAGTSATAVTTTSLDLSFYLLYSTAFAAANGLSAGVPDNGTITNGNRTYQLAPYNAGNGLYLSAAGHVPNTAASGTLALTTPAAFSKLSLLLFSTEGSSVINAMLHFTDGTWANAGSAHIDDWFDGGNAIISGVGRIARQAAPPYLVDGLSGNNPRFYRFDIAMACSNQPKLLDSIRLNYAAGEDTSSRAVILALAGVSYVPVTVTADITPATCDNADGVIALTAAGGTPPLSYAWTSSPAQVNDTATGLPAGRYSCTILDVYGCATTYTGTVPRKTAAVLTAAASTGALCAGSSATLTATANAPVTDYSWQPGNGNSSTLTVTPDATTRYIVSAVDTLGCTVSDTVDITVTPVPGAPQANAVTACADSTAMLVVQNAESAYTYSWYTAASGGTAAGTGSTFTAPASATAATYYVQAGNAGCTSARVPVNVSRLPAMAIPVVTAAQITPASVTFVWEPVSGAAGYQVSVNGAAYTAPSSGLTGTTHQVSGVSLAQGVSIQVIALGGEACQNSRPGDATAKLLNPDIFIPNAFTPNNDGHNDVFRAQGNIITGQEMKIFNQWGELVFETSDPAAGWDGTSQGKRQPMGVYVYTIRLKLANGKEIIRKGAVNLLRP